MLSTRLQVLSLYKSLLKEAQKFSSYNFRNYALRRIRHGFRENKGVDDPNSLNNLILEAKNNLDTIKRQVLIGQMYSTDKLVIENVAKRSNI